jgi:hypothetical protein
MTGIALYSASGTTLPGRNEHPRKIAQRIREDTREYPADDASRSVNRPNTMHRANGPCSKPSGAVDRGPNG